MTPRARRGLLLGGLAAGMLLLAGMGSAVPPANPGSQSLSKRITFGFCWDIDGNGRADPAEDVNDDGFYSGLDCQGPEGPPGPQGPQGPQGPPGADGADGADGAQGPQGPQGPPGADGADGADGQDGEDGVTVLMGGTGTGDFRRSDATSYGPFGAYAAPVTSATQFAAPVPVGGTVSNLFVNLVTAPGASPKTWNFTVMKNGTATALTCSVTGSTSFTCSDTTNSVVFNAGDTIMLRGQPNSTGGSTGPSDTKATWSVEFG